MVYYPAGNVVKVIDAETEEIRRWEDNRGRPLAVMEEGTMVLTPLGERQGYRVRGDILVAEWKPVEEEKPARVPETLGDWSSLGISIKEKDPRPMTATKVNHSLESIYQGYPEMERDMRWLMDKSTELGVSW